MSGREAGGCLDHSMLIGCSVSAEEAALFAGVAAGSDGVDRIEKVRWSASVKAAERGAERGFTAGVTRPPPCKPHGSWPNRGQKVGAIPGSKGTDSCHLAISIRVGFAWRPACPSEYGSALSAWEMLRENSAADELDPALVQAITSLFSVREVDLSGCDP